MMTSLRVQNCYVARGLVLETAAKVRLRADVVLAHADVGPLLPPAIEEPVPGRDLPAQLDSYWQDYPW